MHESGLPPASSTSYPVDVDLAAPLEMARWRPFAHWFLAIPHFVVLYVYGLVLGVLTLIAFFTILFTGNIPPSMFDFMVGVYRYQWRVTSYAYFMREGYPSFAVEPAAVDPGTDPAPLSVVYPERLSRLLPVVKWLLALPHYIVLVLLGLVAFVALGIGAFAVLFTGRWPASLRDFLVGVTRWSNRVTAYVSLLTDRYPPFALAP